VGVALYWRLLFAITKGISIPRLLWMQCEDGSIHKGAVKGFDRICRIK
jgi:hypothetical protein